MRNRKALAAFLLISAAVIAVSFQRVSSRHASRDQIPPQTQTEAQKIAGTRQTSLDNAAKFLDRAAQGTPAAVPVSGGGGGGGKRSETPEVLRRAVDYQPPKVYASLPRDAPPARVPAAPPAPGSGGGGGGKRSSDEPSTAARPVSPRQ